MIMKKLIVVLVLAVVFTWIAPAVGTEPPSPSPIEQSREHYETGLRHLVSKEYDRAIEEFKIAIDLDREFPDAYRKLVRAHLQKQDINTAIQYLEELKLKDTADPFAHYGVGLAYQGAEDHAAAIGHLEKSIELSVRFAMAYAQFVNSSVAIGRLERAEEFFHSLIESDSTDALAHFGLGCLRGSRSRDHFFGTGKRSI